MRLITAHFHSSSSRSYSPTNSTKLHICQPTFRALHIMDVFHNNPRRHEQKDVNMVLSLWFWSSQLKAACSTWDLDNLLYAHDDIMVNFRGYFSVTRSYITIPSCKACFSSSLIFLSEAFLYLSNSLSFSSLSLSITGSENYNHR